MIEFNKDSNRDKYLMDIANGFEGISSTEYFFRCIERQREKIDKALKTNPLISETVRDDMRYQLGYLTALEDVLSMQENAKKEILKGR